MREKPSEGFRAEARLMRNLGGEGLARKWDKQAEMEEAYEASPEGIADWAIVEAKFQAALPSHKVSFIAI